MNDQTIIDLYFARDECAIEATAQQYGKLCHRVAYNILDQTQDAEECVNDAYLRVWNSIPPERPDSLSAYLCRITRNLAINRFRAARRTRRGGGEIPLAIEELGEVFTQDGSAELERIALRNALSSFLHSERPLTREIFVKRYWYVYPIADIAAEYGMTEGRVTMLLRRARERLRKHLRKEGFEHEV